ncbi:hypothetical protein ACRAWF_31275 [Streptomyces sp. L7]
MSDSRVPGGRRWLLVAVFAAVVFVMVRAANTPQGASTPRREVPPPRPPRQRPPSRPYEPADYASQVLSLRPAGRRQCPVGDGDPLQRGVQAP